MRPARRRTTRGNVVRAFASLLLALCVSFQAPAALADAAFDHFIQSLWPDAQKLGVSRATFDAATRGLEPDLTLPDLVLPGKAERPQPPQAEFVQTPADYLREATIARLATQGKKLSEQHRATLAAIEQRFGVPPHIILAIWGRETAFGGHMLPHNAIRVLATQAYLGRRKDMFRDEFLTALKILQSRQARRHEKLLGRRDGAHAIPADRVLQARDRHGRRRQARHLDLGAGCAGVRGGAACRQGLAARQALGP